MSSTVEELEESFSNTNLSEIDDAILDAQDAYFDVIGENNLLITRILGKSRESNFKL